jgi:hypothetical protein
LVVHVDWASPPGEHLGLFCGNQKTQFFASFATNGNTARVKIAPEARLSMHPTTIGAMDAIHQECNIP